jgi:hypothetical protein
MKKTLYVFFNPSRLHVHVGPLDSLARQNHPQKEKAMAVTRRRFLKTGSIVAIAAGAAGIPIEAAAKALKESKTSETAKAAAVPMSAVTHFDMAAFAQYLNTEFVMSHIGATTTVMKLTEIKNWRKETDKKRGECFSLVFSTSENTELVQNTYSIEHRSLGTFSLLIVPAGKTGNTYHYEALFNRLR